VKTLESASAGQSIRVIVDKIPAGTYQIDKRLGPRGGFTSARASIAPDQGKSILKLLQVGENVQFVTEQSTYSASLSGAKQSMNNFGECATEANHLEMLKSSQAQRPQ